MRRSLPVAAAFAATTALLLTACGNGGDGSKGNDKIAGADTGTTKTSASASASASDSIARPDLTLPGDIKETFQSWTTGDATKDAILADAGHAQTAVTYAVVKGDLKSEALAFYQAGSALPGSRDWVKTIVDSGSTFTGAVRYYSPKLAVFDKQSAGLSYCSDESRAFNKNRKTRTIDKTPANNDSYVLYSTRLEKNGNGIWQTTKLVSDRGNKTCTP